MSWSQITNARAGRHTCFDRFVVDLRGTLRGYDVRYAPVYTDGQGKRVWLKGDADLRVEALITGSALPEARKTALQQALQAIARS